MTGIYDMTIIGGIGIDTNIYLHGEEIDFSVEMNFSENLDYVGQVGGYAARLSARLGNRTAFIGFVGDDYNGRFASEVLHDDGINHDALFIDPHGTKRAVNFMYPDGRRRNFYDGKGSMETKPDPMICNRILGKTTVAHFSIVDWARTLLPVAKRFGSTVSCDIQDIVTMNDAYRKDFIDAADILFFSSANHPDPTPLIRDFLKGKPDRIVMCGMGYRGCMTGTASEIRHHPAVELDTPVIDTNGAGDSLAVGFLTSYLLEGRSLEDSVLRGQLCARHTCSQKADSSHLMSSEELDKILRDKRFRVNR